MINLDVFLVGLFITSTLTSLTTEAFKKIFTEQGVSYKANTLAGFVAVLISAAVGVSYIALNGLDFSSQNIIYLVMNTFMSWLCAMLGYDKVVQTISQFKTNNKEDASK